MSYNQTGTPRFFIDYFEHWKMMGEVNSVSGQAGTSIWNYTGSPNTEANGIATLGLDPTNDIVYRMDSVISNTEVNAFYIDFNKNINADYFRQIDYYGFLGHTFTNISLDNQGGSGAYNGYPTPSSEHNLVHAIIPRINTNTSSGRIRCTEPIINIDSQAYWNDDYWNIPSEGFTLAKADWDEETVYYDNTTLENSSPTIVENTHPNAVLGSNVIDRIGLFSRCLDAEGNSVDYNASYLFGGFTMGHTYTMPHSPDLSLSFEIEYDGYDQVQTLGGSTLTKVNYHSAPLWAGALNPWEVFHTPRSNSVYPENHGGWINPDTYQTEFFNESFRRKGRRTWALKFSYLKKEDLFSSNHSTNRHYNNLGNVIDALQDELAENEDLNVQNYVEDGVYNVVDLVEAIQNYGWTDWAFQYNMLTDDSFESRVLNFIGTGQRFIFQPDSNSKQPSDFAICVLDQDSLKASQVANGVYNISMKIREVW